jgi:hypothetical protein
MWSVFVWRAFQAAALIYFMDALWLKLLERTSRIALFVAGIFILVQEHGLEYSQVQISVQTLNVR